VITVAMSCAIRAVPMRVWRALTDPNEVAAWDAVNGNGGALDAPPDYPKPGQHVRWRYRQGGVPTLLHDRPIEVVQASHLRSLIELGQLRFDETYTLLQEGEGGTRLGMRIIAENVVPVVGGVLDRFEVRRLVTEMVSSSLEAIRTFCERDGSDV